MVKAELLTGVRGEDGGCQRSKAPEQYTVESILRVTEDPMAPVSCLDPGADACLRSAACRTLPMRRGLDKLITEYLESIPHGDRMHSDPDGYDDVI